MCRRNKKTTRKKNTLEETEVNRVLKIWRNSVIRYQILTGSIANRAVDADEAYVREVSTNRDPSRANGIVFADVYLYSVLLIIFYFISILSIKLSLPLKNTGLAH